MDREWNDFYGAFEKKFRGDPTLIQKRLSQRYIPRLTALREGAEVRQALDLGCGHGEMLQVLTQNGFTAFGVDQSEVAVGECLEAGLKAVVADLLVFLKDQKSSSCHFVSLLHVIEHCDPKFSFQVCREVFRVLKPGGVFLVETPSLFSLWAGCRQFYLDPTHERPIHPEYIQFLMEYFGFSTRELLFFDPVEHPDKCSFQRASGDFSKLERWLYGPMDVACWAQK